MAASQFSETLEADRGAFCEGRFQSLSGSFLAPEWCFLSGNDSASFLQASDC